MESKINSNEYWDKRFDSDWDLYNGKEQTSFFVDLLTRNLPPWLISDFKINNRLICDAGCAEGQGTFLFKRCFPNINIEGIDFSEVAINNAKQHYPELNFKKDDIYDLSQAYDIIFCSNVLEHFSDPLAIVGKLLQKTRQHLIIMVPFQETNRLKEHFFTFDYKDFPLRINNFSLSYFKEIDCRVLEKTLWNGKQSIIIYTENSLIDESIKLDSFEMMDKDNGNYQLLNNKLMELNEKVEALSNWGSDLQRNLEHRDSIIVEQTNKIEELSQWSKGQQKEIEKRDIIIQEQNDKIEKVSKWGTSLKNNVEERDNIIKDLNQRLEEMVNWAKSLEIDVKQRDEIIIQSNKKLEEMANWAKSLEIQVKQRDNIIKKQNGKHQ